MAKYTSQKEKIIEFIEKTVIPSFNETSEIDYNKMIYTLASEKGFSENTIDEVFQTFIKAGKLTLIIRLSDEEILKKRKEMQEQIKKDFKEVGLNGKEH